MTDNTVKLGAGLIHGGVTYAARVESNSPVGFRFARYPDGRKTLQGAYQWTEGFKGGITWKDLPMVDVDGQEIECD